MAQDVIRREVLEDAISRLVVDAGPARVLHHGLPENRRQEAIPGAEVGYVLARKTHANRPAEQELGADARGGRPH